MNFISAYYWQQGGDMLNSASLLLHQLSIRKDKEDILFACVCESTKEKEITGYMTERLQVWFYENALPWCRNKKSPLSLGEGLYRVILQTDGELGGVCPCVCGLFCIGSSILLFYRGQSDVCLLNSRFQKANLRRLSTKPKELVLQWGEIQTGAGILLATHNFYTVLGKETVRECLAVGEIHTKEQAEKRIRELGGEAERRNVKNAGAILVLAKQLGV